MELAADQHVHELHSEQMLTDSEAVKPSDDRK